MPEPTPSRSTPPGAAPASKVAKRIRPRVDWKAVWPIPLAVASAGLLATGIAAGVIKMPKDDPAIPLAEASQLFNEERYLDALDMLNADAVPMFNKGIMVPDQQREFYQLRARSLLYGQEKLGVEQESNYRQILESFEAGKALQLELSPADLSGIAQAHLFLGETEKAVKIARGLAGVDDERRLKLYRKIVQRTLKASAKDSGLALELLTEMLEMPELADTERAWIIARQAELRIAGGFADEAAVRLLRDFNKLEGLDEASRAELLFLLGKSYYLGNKNVQAHEFLRAAEQGLPAFDDRRGESAVLRGLIKQAAGDNDSARECFELVASGFADSPQQLPALLGLAESEAALGNAEGSLRFFADLIDAVHKRGPHAGVTLDAVGERLLARARDLLLQGQPEDSLRFALRSEDAFKKVGAVPPEVNLAIAVANRACADRITADAGVKLDQYPPAWSELSDVSATETKGHLLDAGAYFRQHARQMVIAEYDAQMDSLWRAAEAFDLAGDTDAAIEAFSTFMQGARPDFPRRAEGVFRLARVYESRGEYATAANLYEQLRAARSDGAGITGVWADRSIVPLARCYINMPAKPVAKGEAKSETKPDAHAAATPAPGAAVAATDDPNQRKAIELLSEVVDGGRILEPDSPEFKEALAQLGELHHKRGEFDQAISRLRQSLQRDPSGHRSTMLRFKLADSHRRAAIDLQTGIGEEPLSQRAVSEATRLAHLEEAEKLYRQVAVDISRKPAPRISKLENILRRNSVLYAADCVYLSGRYAEAVRLYLAVRDQAPGDPAALVAMAQTVSALVKMDRWEEAKSVHERARQLLASIPDAAWDDPDNQLPMDRKHWEAWLESGLQIDQHLRPTRAPATASAPSDG